MSGEKRDVTDRWLGDHTAGYAGGRSNPRSSAGEESHRNRPLGFALLFLFLGFWACLGGLAWSLIASVRLAPVAETTLCDWTADFLIGHLQTSENRWPRGWQDLRDEFDAGQRHGYAFDFADLRRHVDVDWSTDVATVARRSARPPEAAIASLDPPVITWRPIDDSQIDDDDAVRAAERANARLRAYCVVVMTESDGSDAVYSAAPVAAPRLD